jgi:hypothetical protein
VTEIGSELFFPLSYSPFNAVMFRPIGLGSARSGVWVTDDNVRVAMGHIFRVQFARTAVRSIGPDAATVDGWGVHGWRGVWLVNGSSTGIVRLGLEPGVRARVLGVSVELTTLRVGVTSPDELISILG